MACFASRISFTLDGLTKVRTTDLGHEECNICYNPYRLDGVDLHKDTEEPIQLPCGHVFGLHCILRWTQDSNSCPNCRAILFSPGSSADKSYQNNSNTEFSDDISLEPITNWEILWYELMGIEFDRVRLGGPSGTLRLDRAHPTGERISQVALTAVSTNSQTGTVYEPEHGAHGYCLEYNYRISDASGISNHVHSAKQKCSQENSSPMSPISPTVEELLDHELIVSDVDMYELAESHDQWMYDFVSESESESEDEDDDDDFFC
jgi:hypothetical protein